MSKLLIFCQVLTEERAPALLPFFVVRAVQFLKNPFENILQLVNQNPRPVVVVLPGENFNLNPNKFTNAGLAPSVALYNSEIKPGCSGKTRSS